MVEDFNRRARPAPSPSQQDLAASLPTAKTSAGVDSGATAPERRAGIETELYMNPEIRVGLE